MVEQWVDHPATVGLKQMLTERLNWLTESKSQIFYPNEPNRTQEAICTINAQIKEAEIFILLLNTEQFLSEVDDLEQVQRDNPDRLSSLN